MQEHHKGGGKETAATSVTRNMDSAHANEDFQKMLIEMGFPEDRSRKALIETHNMGMEAAINWLMENDTTDVDIPMTSVDASSSYAMALGSTSEFDPVVGVPSMGLPPGMPVVVHPDGGESSAMVIGVSGECKIVLVVPRDLGLSAGKLGSQCAHAAVGMYRVMMVNRVPWLTAWEMQGEKTVVLGVDTSEEMEHLARTAQDKTLLTYSVEDAGRTEVEPGAKTMVAIGGLTEVVDQVTGHLNTY
ncbi:hypothetical protein BSKO_10180 [Bryopsis sp. KO-2023]|nr:hypothetical protein BSKO_10180 [Bryopsis sp. KO-2023]